jgi:hypothetical protein
VLGLDLLAVARAEAEEEAAAREVVDGRGAHRDGRCAPHEDAVTVLVATRWSR